MLTCQLANLLTRKLIHMNEKSRFHAVLFDMDGVLINSMPAHVKSWQQVYAEYGIDIEADEIKLREGEKAQSSAKDICRKHGMSLTDTQISELVARKRKIYRSQAPEGMVEGASELLRRLKAAGLKLALVTGSILINLKKVVDKRDIELFDCIITSDHVLNCKPHPEPFLKAAEAIGVAPQRCIVIENAPLGIRAAKSAGMSVAAITSTLPKEKLTEANFILEGLSQVEEIVFNQI